MITNLFIATTAINREDLHTDVFSDWVRLLNQSTKIKIVWFINIDVINLLEYTFEETKKNFKRLIPFEIIFLPQKQAGFLDSCFLLSTQICNYVIQNEIDKNNVCILWLEDDWKLKDNINVTFDYLIQVMNGNSYVSLSLLRKNYFWALAPSLLGFNIFENLHVKCWANAKNSNIIGDPENILGQYFLNNFDSKPEEYKTVNLQRIISEVIDEKYLKYNSLKTYSFRNNVTEIRKFIKDEINFIRVFPSFVHSGDIGRAYMAQKGIQKWERGDPSCQYSSIPKINNSEDPLLSIFRENTPTRNNIIYLVDKKLYLTKMSRIRFHAIRALENLANVLYWGPGWDNYDLSLSLDENIDKQNLIVDFVIFYKSRGEDQIGKCKVLKCITYNEMWNEETTLNEINNTKPDLVICHHQNDLINYTNNLFKDIGCYTQFVHIPHCAEKTIFFDRYLEKEIDVLLCGIMARCYSPKSRIMFFLSALKECFKIINYFTQSVSFEVKIKRVKNSLSALNVKLNTFVFGYYEQHYPLRQKFRSVLKLMPAKYNCIQLSHPGYRNLDASTDVYQQQFSEIINKSKICLTCTSRYKYRLGKMVEIPMAGSVLACDLPKEDQQSFEDNMIVIDERMSNKDIADKLIYYLENDNKLETIRKNGHNWSQKYNQEYYATHMLQNLEKLTKKEIKLFVLGEDFKKLKTNWICDHFKDEFVNYSTLNIVAEPRDADIIWILAPWCVSKIDEKILEQKFVVTTIHHIDFAKYRKNKKKYEYIDKITNRYHAICDKSFLSIKKISKKAIVIANFWINERVFFEIKDKKSLRQKYHIPLNAFVIGSFQKDTEGKGYNKPKLSKGPDIFIAIIKDLKDRGKEPIVILTGFRRTYMMKHLDKLKIKFLFFEMVEIKQLNELYNCLDLYIVSSRVEGGPRSILECAITKTPIISTNVGIAELILSSESIYDINDFKSYKTAKPNTEFAFKNAQQYFISNYMKSFVNKVFYEIRN